MTGDRPIDNLHRPGAYKTALYYAMLFVPFVVVRRAIAAFSEIVDFLRPPRADRRGRAAVRRGGGAARRQAGVRLHTDDSGLRIDWSTPSHSPGNVQEFHRDYDDWRFIKLFMDLTDVDDGSGPHAWGVHKGSAPRSSFSGRSNA